MADHSAHTTNSASALAAEHVHALPRELSHPPCAHTATGAARPLSQREREDLLDADIADYTERTLRALRDGRTIAARASQAEARKLIARRTPAHVERLEREKGLR